MKKSLKAIAMGLFLASAAFQAAFAQTPSAQDAANTIQFIFTSDAHYGITRANFRGATKVDGHTVNAALVAKLNGVSAVTLPDDSGISGNKQVGPVDFIVEGGDIANREEGEGTAAIQSASASWKQFQGDYIDGITLTDDNGKKTPIWIIPGNHDVTNAIGFYKAMTPATDATAMAEIYNRMMNPAKPETAATYAYAKERINYSRDMGGVHFVFITIWPDSTNVAWMEKDLKAVSPTTPVVIFSHDQPEVEAKHLANPNGAHDINKTDKFENMLSDQLADGKTIDAPTTIEQAAFEKFLVAHKNVVAYFHGNDHVNRIYDWVSPNRKVTLRTVGSDSPMKGSVSAKDETKLAFDLVSIDVKTQALTVRNGFWNADPAKAGAPIVWSAPVTFSLQSRL